ncbi:GNAT family N-acetyltransferase [Actinomadura flavalba]|uniref:GNAT family N-acetyltransferase n=1 Tax=Actinomadura flavalba TaxID=1120938 RepID=UPI0003684BCD|nr:GNAT family N-acetyltransferase [Actinomadura flavalba]
MGERLRTPRLSLRPVTPADHAALLAHWSAPLVRHHLFDDAPVTAAHVAEIIASSRHDFAVAGYGLWALRDAAAGPGAPLLGVAGLRDHGGPDPEILYSLDPGFWGQGLAEEAAAAVLGYALEVVGLRRVTAEVDAGNTASGSLAERIGMRAERRDADGTAHYAAERTPVPGR